MRQIFVKHIKTVHQEKTYRPIYKVTVHKFMEFYDRAVNQKALQVLVEHILHAVLNFYVLTGSKSTKNYVCLPSYIYTWTYTCIHVWLIKDRGQIVEFVLLGRCGKSIMIVDNTGIQLLLIVICGIFMNYSILSCKKIWKRLFRLFLKLVNIFVLTRFCRLLHSS